MPSTKKKAAAPAEPEAAASPDDVQRVDLLDALAVGTPDLEPLQVTLHGVDFSINRWYSPATVWRWSDIMRDTPEGLAAIAKYNRALMRIVIPEADHDKIEDLLAIIENRTVPEARRLYAYLHHLAGLTDKLGNPLAL